MQCKDVLMYRISDLYQVTLKAFPSPRVRKINQAVASRMAVQNELLLDHDSSHVKAYPKSQKVIMQVIFYGRLFARSLLEE